MIRTHFWIPIVTIVVACEVAPGKGSATDVPQTLEAVETLRIGEATGSPEYMFRDITSIAVAEDGRIYVYDLDQGVRVYDRHGGFLRELAGPGQGPGEVEYVSSMHASGGELVLFDLGNARVARFGEQGLIEVALLRGPLRPSYREDAILRDPDGAIWIGFDPLLGPDGFVRFPRPAYARIDEHGGLVDTVFVPERALEGCPTLTSRPHRTGFWDDQREPFVPKVTWARSIAGTLVFGCPIAYRFEVVHPDGSTSRGGRPYDPVPISDDEKDFLAQYGGMGGLPDFKPAYARLIITDDDRVWIWPNAASNRVPLPESTVRATGVTHTWVTGSAGRFDVFSTDGRWLAVVTMPSNFAYTGFPTEPALVIRGDTIWGVVRDPMDVEYVARFEVAGLTRTAATTRGW